jgi:hypothetical protein
MIATFARPMRPRVAGKSNNRRFLPGKCPFAFALRRRDFGIWAESDFDPEQPPFDMAFAFTKWWKRISMGL